MKSDNIDVDVGNVSLQKKKKVIPVIIFLVILVVAVIVLLVLLRPFNKKDASPKKVIYNTNEKVIEDKDVNGILFTDIQCSFDGESSLITYKIVNHTKEAIKLGEYQVIIKDKDGGLLAVIVPSFDNEIAPDESFETGNFVSNVDLSNAYSMELELGSNEKNENVVE